MTQETQQNQDFNNSQDSFEDTLLKLKPHIQKLKSNWKKLLIFNGIVGVIAVFILLFLVKPYFTSSIVILPEYGNSASSMMGSLSGLASMAGISVGDTAPNEIYEKLVRSEKVINDVVYKKYQTEEYTDSVDLIEYFEVETKDEDLSNKLQERDKFLQFYEEMVEKRVKTEVDRMTKVLTIGVTMPEAKLSADVTNNLISALADYIQTDRQSFAKAQREYLDNRIKEVRDSLNMFEDKLKEFRENNRSISNSPQLVLEQTRIAREVEIAQSVFLELFKQFELIKLEEVKDTPVLNVMEEAQQPILKAGPKRSIALVVIMFFSGIFSGLYILFEAEVKKYWKIVKE